MSKGDYSTLTFTEFSSANQERLPLHRNAKGLLSHPAPHGDGSNWNVAEWCNAMAGEVGEACNLAKKIVRGDFGQAGSPQYQSALRELAIECADVITYADLVIQRTDHSTADMVATKFNLVSAKVGAPVYIVGDAL